MLEEFKTDLRNAAMTEVAILDKYIFSGNPFIFCANTGLYAQLKAKITTHFGIGITAAHMVGSAKLGFSVAPDKLWKPFGEESDIDMVIISEDVFNILWEELSSINSLSYDTSKQGQDKYKLFLKYFFRGWIRPDLLPQNHPRLVIWDNYFKEISYKEYGQYKINGAVFKNEFFFRMYHERNLESIRKGL